jgi:hypothetical protein
MVALSTWGNEGIAPPFLTLALDGREQSASRPCCFTTGKKFRYPLHRRMHAPQGRSERFEVGNSFCLSWELNPGCPARSRRYTDVAISAHENK